MIQTCPTAGVAFKPRHFDEAIAASAAGLSGVAQIDRLRTESPLAAGALSSFKTKGF